MVDTDLLFWRRLDYCLHMPQQNCRVQYDGRRSFSALNLKFSSTGEKAHSYVPGTDEHREKRNNQTYGTSGYDSGRGYDRNDNRSGYGTSSGYNDASRHTGNTSGTSPLQA